LRELDSEIGEFGWVAANKNHGACFAHAATATRYRNTIYYDE